MSNLARARARVLSATLVSAILAAGCTSAPSVTPTAPPTAAQATAAPNATAPTTAPSSLAPASAVPSTPGPGSPTPTTAATEPASPSAAHADTLTWLTYRGDFDLSNTSESSVGRRFLYDTLYRLDTHLQPVPGLATEMCEIAADLVTITCDVRPAKFHDGSILTADDVAFTYQLSASPECGWAGGDTGSCVGDRLSSVRAVDQDTVEFVLAKPDPTVTNEVFTNVGIESKANVTRQFDEMMAKAAGHDPKDLDAAAATVQKQFDDGTFDCEPLVDVNEALLDDVGAELPSRDYFTSADGAFDPCYYAGNQADYLHSIATAMGLSGTDAIAAAYRALPLQQHPVGTSSWKLSQMTPTEIDLEAWPDGAHGMPATPNVRLIAYDFGDPDVAQKIKADFDSGTLDAAMGGADDTLMAGNRAVQQISYVGNDVTYVEYNVRPGMLFSDANLRKAIEMCVDKPRTVESVTQGTGTPVYSIISPASWAYADDLPRVERDVDAAKALIESSGWTMGPDGIYRKDGKRLSAKAWVRDDIPARLQFLQLVQAQVKDCGIDLAPAPTDSDSLFGMIGEYPHDQPGTKHPFDAIIVAANELPDPADDTGAFDSRLMTGPDRPSFDPFGEVANITGYSDPEVDQLLDEGKGTYDQRERARIYKQFQHAIADAQPWLFGWSSLTREYRDPEMTSTLGPLAPDAPNWWSALETLQVPPVTSQ